MAAPSIPPEMQEQIIELAKNGLSDRKIGTELGISATTVLHYRQKAGLTHPYTKIAKPEISEPIQHAAIRKAIQKTPLSVDELADLLDCSPRRIRETLDEMKAGAAMIGETVDGKFQILPSVVLEPGKSEVSGSEGDWTHIFGVTADNHLCNRNSRLDVLNAAYDHFERQGIAVAYNAGNFVDGEAKFNRNELVTAPGMDHQLDYLIDKWPSHKGIETRFVAGDDHEGWWQQREGVEIGRYLQRRAEDQGRQDLKYLGYGEADVELKYGTGSAIMRVVHGGGGSAYATSYTAQKLVESYQGGEKPQILIIGHYHKAEYGYPREVHCLQAGCTEDQSLFMRKKKISAHVGFWVIKIKQAEDGHVCRFATEWFPFYDRAFYQSSYR